MQFVYLWPHDEQSRGACSEVNADALTELYATGAIANATTHAAKSAHTIASPNKSLVFLPPLRPRSRRTPSASPAPSGRSRVECDDTEGGPEVAPEVLLKAYRSTPPGREK
eukprot:Amastigsp_a844722_27.p3 type:complete len:111 gc:universal Amastigsp_a844722_27:315-647(+)